MKKIITISRVFGAGGGEIGSRLSNELGIEWYDKGLILTAAAESNIDVYTLAKWDEKVPIHFGFTQSLFEFYNKPLSEQIFEAQKTAIKKIAESGSCIIIGRNANTILKEYENSLHIFIHADFDWRLQRMRHKMKDIPENKQVDYIKLVDKAREKYCAYHSQTVFGAAENYDLCLDSSRLGIDKCIEIIKNAAI